MFGLWYRVRDGTLSRVDFQREMRPLHARIGRLLRAGIRRQHAKTRHTCANILKVEDALWTFVTTEGVAPTNNAAERALHRAVLWRRRPVAQSVASSVGHPPAPGVFSPSACPLSSHLMVAGARACARRRSGLGVLLVARRGHASPSNRLTSDMGHLAAGHDGAVWQLTLPHLTSGTYSVFWTSESATDGHVMSSFYTFRVAPTGGADGAAPVTLGESRADLLRSLDAATVAAPYRWTFGDGTTALGHVVTHRYTRPGLYLVGVAGFNGQTRQWFPFDKALLRVVPPGQVIQSNLGYYGLRALDIAMSALMWIVDGGLVLLIVGVIISRQTTSAPRES